MEKLYTIGFHKLYDRQKAEVRGVRINDQIMDMFFCQEEGLIYVIAGLCKKGAAYRGADCRWHSGKLYYDIFYRRNFRSKSEGNQFYLQVKKTMEA